MRALAVLSTGVLLFASACSNMSPTATPSATTAAVPAPPTVFFLKDSADLAASDGNDVIRQTAEKAKAGNIARVTITGYADTYGPVNYNAALAKRRAETVKAALVTDGVTKPIDARGATAEEHFDAGVLGDHGMADRRATITLVPAGGAATPQS